MGEFQKNGWLVAISKEGTFTSDDTTMMIIPDEYIRYDTFKATYQPIDVNSGESMASGRLYRKVLKRRKLKVEWNIPACTDTQMQKFFTLLRDRWVGERGQKLYIKAYIPSLGKYVSDMAYLTSDLNFAIIKKTENNSPIKELMYGETRVAFIGYATKTATYNGVPIKK